MIKNYFIKAAAILAMGFVFSCDNTTDDPINNNKNNPNNPNNGGGNTATITGPRILHKITANNIINQEYVTNGTILEKAIFKETSAANSYIIAKVTYTSGKITKVKFDQEVNGSVPANNISQEYNITYDASGKINFTTCYRTIAGVPNFDSEYTYTYDGTGKMTKIVEKKKSGNAYSFFYNYNITYTGNNISKMIMENGMTNSAGVPDMSTVFTSTYNYSSYDSKINPYNTLPKEFFVVWSLYHPFNFYSLSANNLTDFSIVTPSAPAIPGTLNYLYDSQDYPVSDQLQSQKYIYKAL